MMYVFLIFALGGGTLISQFMESRHSIEKQKLKIRQSEIELENKRLDVMKSYALSYDKAYKIVQDRLFDALASEQIEIENTAQQQALDDIENGQRLLK